MPTEKTITLYTFDELNESAKEVAKDWWLECRDETDYESVIDDFVNVAEMMGFTLKTRSVELMSGKHRQDPCVYYSLGYCQGDFAAFEGQYAFIKGAADAVKLYAPQDIGLHSIADGFQALQERNLNQLHATVTDGPAYGIEIDIDRDDEAEISNDDYKSFKELVRDFNGWLYKQLMAQDEYLRSDEQIAEAMEANEYTFRENGKREG